MAEHNLLNGKNLRKLPDGLHRDRQYLSFEVRNGGTSHAWAFRYTKPDGTKGRINIGPLGKVSLADARKIADKFCGWLSQGKDPAAEREIEAAQTKKESVTVNEMVDKFREKKIAKRRHNTKKSAETYFKMIKAAVGTLPAVSVTRDILIDKLELERLWREKHVTCQQLCGYLSRIFAIVQSDFHLPENAGANLTIGFEASRDVHTVEHHPEMHFSEVPEFLAAVRNYKVRKGAGRGEHPNVALWCEAVFLTAVRPGEMRKARWKGVDWKTNTWNIPPEDRKTEEHHIRPIPITKSLLKVLLEMRRRHQSNATDADLATSDDPVFPSEQLFAKKGKLLEFNESTGMKFIRWSLLWPRRLTMHSARNAFVGWAEANKHDSRWIDWQLDHLLPGESEKAQGNRRRSSSVDKAYRRNTLLEERRKMMEHYDADCNRLKPLPASVTKIFQHRRTA